MLAGSWCAKDEAALFPLPFVRKRAGRLGFLLAKRVDFAPVLSPSNEFRAIKSGQPSEDSGFGGIGRFDNNEAI